MLVYQRVCRNHPVMGVVLLVRPANALHFPVDRLSKRNQSIYKTPKNIEKEVEKHGKAMEKHGKSMLFHIFEKNHGKFHGKVHIFLLNLSREIPHSKLGNSKPCHGTGTSWCQPKPGRDAWSPSKVNRQNLTTKKHL